MPADQLTYSTVIAVMRKLQTKLARQKEAIAATEAELALWGEKELSLRATVAEPKTPPRR